MDPQGLCIVASDGDVSNRLDVFVALKTDLTRSQAQRLIESGHIRVNDSPSTKDYRLKKGDEVYVEFQKRAEPTLLPEPIPLSFYYIDDYIAIVEKPAGMVVYPSLGHDSGTLLNGLCYHSKKLATVGLPLRPGIVHRLDKDTSGIMVIALDDIAYYDLIEQFRHRTVNRRYLAIIHGSPRHDYGEVAYPIGRSKGDRKKMSIKTNRGKDALTTWRVLRRYNNASLIELKLGTGRTHQIRVHMAAIGHPVLGDRVYGSKGLIQRGSITYPVRRQMLHAATLGIVHPITRQYLEFQSEMPLDMSECLKVL